MRFEYGSCSLESGIYEIWNEVSNRYYLGQAKRFKERWAGHKSALRKNRLQNRFFQTDYNKCCLVDSGRDDFLVFRVIEVMSGSTKSERNARENFWLSHYRELGRSLYNVVLDNTKATWVKPSDTERIRRRKSELLKERWATDRGFRERMSGKNHRCYGKPPSERNVEATRQTNQGNRWNVGRKHSEDTRRKMSAAAKKRGLLRETQEKAWGANRGRKLSEEHKKKLLVGLIGRTPSDKQRQTASQVNSKFWEARLISPEGILYGPFFGLRKFCLEMGLLPDKITLVIRGERPHHKGWKLHVEDC